MIQQNVSCIQEKHALRRNSEPALCLNQNRLLTSHDTHSTEKYAQFRALRHDVKQRETSEDAKPNH